MRHIILWQISYHAAVPGFATGRFEKSARKPILHRKWKLLSPRERAHTHGFTECSVLCRTHHKFPSPTKEGLRVSDVCREINVKRGNLQKSTVLMLA